MEQKDSGPTVGPPVEFDEQAMRSLKAFGKFTETITPWLFGFGNWVFGGLIAFTSIVVAALITVGPVHPAILISVTAFVCALPFNVTGLFLLKLTQDMNEIAIDDLMKQAFEEAEFPDVEAYFPSNEAKDSRSKRRMEIALRYSVVIVALSLILTVIGVAAAVWYMSWWIAILFLVMVLLSSILLLVVMSQSMPLETDAEKRLKLRRQELRAEQRRDRRKKAD